MTPLCRSYFGLTEVGLLPGAPKYDRPRHQCGADQFDRQTEGVVRPVPPVELMHLEHLDRITRDGEPEGSVGVMSGLRQLGVDVRRIDDDVLNEDARLDLVALQKGGEDVDAELAPKHRIEFDRHR